MFSLRQPFPKSAPRFLLVSLAFLLAILALPSAPAPAQDDDLDLSLTFNLTDYAFSFQGDKEAHSYSFSVKYNGGITYFTKLDNLVLSTDHGDLKFPGAIDPANNPIITASLESNQQIGILNITRALGDIDGVRTDLLRNVYAITPQMDIRVITPETIGCPIAIKDFSALEGEFIELSCGDYCEASIRLGDGETKFFIFDDYVSHFFYDEQNIGKRVKFIVEKRQHFLRYSEPDGDVLGNCMTDDFISNYFVVE
ncbi:MAG: hypothetical protein LBO66_01740 [Deltaproteobacteria bacterium]|jgi:hypothetical protein|nr:hypothetical protein [Deltaproteobacteria bacterium]